MHTGFGWGKIHFGRQRDIDERIILKLFFRK
jgi:hypothetical protein